jgi:hypothetical protein
VAGPPARSRRRRGLGQGVAYAAPHVMTAPPGGARSIVPTTGRVLELPGMPRVTLTMPPPGIPVFRPRFDITPATPVTTAPTTVGPQVPAYIMPASGMTDQGYGPPSPEMQHATMTSPGDGGSGGGAPPLANATPRGIDWRLIALGAAALGGLYLATR